MKASSWFSQMLGTALTLDNLEKVLLLQLRDLYSAENQLIAALPKMAEAAHTPELKRAFQTHLSETRGHKQRLEQACRLLNQDPKGHTCDAMKGLISEGEEVIGLEGDHVRRIPRSIRRIAPGTCDPDWLQRQPQCAFGEWRNHCGNGEPFDTIIRPQSRRHWHASLDRC